MLPLLVFSPDAACGILSLYWKRTTAYIACATPFVSILRTFITCLLLTGGLTAQSPSGPRPGKNDPFNSLAKLTLFADDELFSFSPDNPNQLVQRLYRTDKGATLSLKDVTTLGSVPENPVVAASGRISDPARATVAFAQRSLGTSNLQVHVINGKTVLVTSALADRNVPAYATDNIAITVGDVDKVVDSDLNYRGTTSVAATSPSS